MHAPIHWNDGWLAAVGRSKALSDLFTLRGVPAHIRSDNGPEFVAKAVQEWIAAIGAKTAYIERGSAWRTATSRASTRAFATSCSRAKSSTRSERPESSSRAGGATTHQAARLTWIQATSSGGVRACLRRVAGCATTSGSAGHAGATANLKLTFHLDHSTGADHCTPGAKAELPRAAGAARAFH
jgi:hypothetical protein